MKPAYIKWAVWVALAATAPGLFAQPKEGKQAPPPAPHPAGSVAAPKAAAGPPKPAQQQLKAGPPGGPKLDRPVYPLDRWAQMDPAQRQAALAKLPPERRENVQQRLAHWETMPEVQKERVRRVWLLPPDQKKIVREHTEWLQTLPQERRVVLRKETNLLEQMSPEARQAELESPSFNRKFDGVEREHLQKIVSTMSKEE